MQKRLAFVGVASAAALALYLLRPQQAQAESNTVTLDREIPVIGSDSVDDFISSPDPSDDFSSQGSPDNSFLGFSLPPFASLIGGLMSDSNSWPSGDKVWDFCRAIAKAEGFGIPGDNPTRLNNPGDISDYADVYGYENHSGSKVTHFPDEETGWDKLYEKIDNARNGLSHVYSPDMTFEQFARTYAGNWKPWLATVTRELGVSSQSTVGGYFA